MSSGTESGGLHHARRIWQRIETIHAVTYFAPESIAAATEAGLRGFWMGYFGCRAAPLGPVPAAVVDAAFANFATPMVERAIPDAWSYADPADLVLVRAGAAAAALRRVAPDVDRDAAAIAEPLAAAIAAADPIGRPLFAANRLVAPFDDPVARLWQCCTTLREHRGDGHVAALVAAGVDGCEAHLLLAADHSIDPQIHFEHRGWTPAEQLAAAERLRARGLLATGALELTAAGRALRADVESATDAAAGPPFDRALDAGARHRLIGSLDPVARAVAASGVLPFPNPMGLPALV